MTASAKTSDAGVAMARAVPRWSAVSSSGEVYSVVTALTSSASSAGSETASNPVGWTLADEKSHKSGVSDSAVG